MGAFKISGLGVSFLFSILFSKLSWLELPWLVPNVCVGERLEPLYAPIRHKLASALTNWHPSDASAKIILEPWVGVFRPGHMDAFLVKNVLPKLSQVLDEMQITPNQQSLGWILCLLYLIAKRNTVWHFVSMVFAGRKWLCTVASHFLVFLSCWNNINKSL